ncbi:MAG: Smr/MutS family protein [Treponemataceae bacterium]|nr:Smr/MutS family protein [Treponemataceae bacterium]
MENKKQSFADILDAFEKMEKESKSKAKNKSSGQEWRYKKTEPTKVTLERKFSEENKLKQEETKNQQKKEKIEKINPMTMWLRRYGVVDKDAEEEKIQAKMNQLDRNYLRNMAPEASIDLHGLTKEEATLRLDAFVNECCRRKLTKILIIHGKGNHSTTEPVLAKFVHDYIERSYRLGESGHPDKTEGGRGATWVIIKNTCTI